MTNKRPFSRLCFALLLTFFHPSPVVAAAPYTPSQLLATGQHDSRLIYILDPPSSALPHGQLCLVKPTSTLSASSSPIQTLESSLSFLQNDPSLAYHASIADSGSINVVVSDCTKGPSGSSVWTYTPSSTGRGAWAQRSITAGNGASAQTALNYLAQSVTFTPTSKSNSSIYTFGGMCPHAGATNSDWVSAASYSNQLVVLQEDSTSEYDFQLGTSRGQPIAEAGFSLTPLLPSFSNASDGTQTTTQSFLLLGGQTHDAFINTSQVALFTLPQASWTFLPVGPGGDKSDLKVRASPAQIEPRSGHTALLTSDGSKVVMFGGWVGDVSSPAEPQLAILNVGAGFGGDGSWTWADGALQPDFAPGSAGLYGHGATMLDGDVMMIYAGISIPSETGTKTRRAPAQSTMLFYNVTGNAWIASYDPKKVPALHGAADSSNDASQQQSIGLGVGLSCGFVAILAACYGSYILVKKSRRYEEQDQPEEDTQRQNEIKDLGDAAYMHQEKVQDPVERDLPGGGALTGQVWDGRGRVADEVETEPGVWIGDSVRDAQRTGVQLDIPSPERGLRRSLASRSAHPGGRPTRRTSGPVPIIAPIEEEQDEDGNNAAMAPATSSNDPFRDPDRDDEVRLPSKTPPPILGALPTLEPLGSLFSQTMSDMNRWINDLGAMAEVRAGNDGRLSPDKSDQDRTMSNLSDMSNSSRMSGASATSSTALRGGQQPAFAVTRPPARSLRILPVAVNPFSAETPTPSPTKSAPDARQRTPTSAPSTSGGQTTDTDSFDTAHTNYVNLQAESDALLGPVRPGQASALHLVEPDEEPTFTRANGRRAPSSRIGGWVGSVRRVIYSAGRTTTNLAMTPTRSLARHGPEGLGGLMVYETRGSATSSPIKKGGVSELAAEERLHEEEDGEQREWHRRRSASDGPGLWTMKRGAEDWGVAPPDSKRRHSLVTPETAWNVDSGPASSSRGGGPSGRQSDDEDWDVEAAAEERNVQVMFSVPKERLRVVNADVESASISDAGQADEGAGETMGRR